MAEESKRCNRRLKVAVCIPHPSTFYFVSLMRRFVQHVRSPASCSICQPDSILATPSARLHCSDTTVSGPAGVGVVPWLDDFLFAKGSVLQALGLKCSIDWDGLVVMPFAGIPVNAAVAYRSAGMHRPTNFLPLCVVHRRVLQMVQIRLNKIWHDC